MNLPEKLDAGTAEVGIIGLGYVGLPLAMAFAKAGVSVTGFDIDPAKIDAIAKAKSYISHIPDTVLADAVATGRLAATVDYERLRKMDAVIICVPTPLKEVTGDVKPFTPDMSFIENTANSIGPRLHKGMLVVLESTTYPGTTDELVRPILEKHSGLNAEKDFLLAFSPEREDPGNKNFSVTSIPKIVGGLTPEARESAEALYLKVTPRVVKVSSTSVAEAAKILENVYRCVNIALVNELKTVFEAMGLDVWEVIEAAKTKPFGFHAFYPGPGLGGHCIPIDPFYLSWKAKQFGVECSFIELAGQVNTAMPGRVVDRTLAAVAERWKKKPKGARVLVLGAAYKKDINDDRESPALEIMEMLQERGVDVTYNDPYIPALKKTRRHHMPLVSVPITEKNLSAADAVLIVTDHSTYDPAFIVKHSRLVVDTRNLTGNVKEGREKIVKA
jgi:UDP-N-acetyl-D-glucosamine dehydrogenase